MVKYYWWKWAAREYLRKGGETLAGLMFYHHRIRGTLALGA